MKTIIAGGRNYNLSAQDIEELNRIKDKITEIVSGAANGADKDGEKWATINNIPVKSFKPDWAQYGKAAGFIRNKEMANYADALVIFPGGKGTENMYSEALKKGLKIYDFRKIKESFNEWLYNEGFGFDWSVLDKKELDKLFKNSSKQIELKLQTKKTIDFLSKKYPSIDSEEIKIVYKVLLGTYKPSFAQSKLTGILDGIKKQNQQKIQEFQNLLSSQSYKTYNIRSEIVRLDTELTNKGIAGLLYFSKDDKPYDLFRLDPSYKRESLKLLKPKGLLLTVKIFYAFELAPVRDPSIDKKIMQKLEDEETSNEGPYEFNHTNEKLKISADGWQNEWNNINKQIKEINKEILFQNQELKNFPTLFARSFGSIPKSIVDQNLDHVELMVAHFKTKGIDLNLNYPNNLTEEEFKEICARKNLPSIESLTFNTIVVYSFRRAKIEYKIDELNKRKKDLQTTKKRLSLRYFKPAHFVRQAKNTSKQNFNKSYRFGTIDSFLKEARAAFTKLIKNPITENQKMVRQNLIEQSVKIYTDKNPNKSFDLIVYPQSKLDASKTNLNRELAFEFSLKHRCPSIEIAKLPKEDFTIDEEGAKTYYKIKQWDDEKIDKTIEKLKKALEKAKKSGDIKTITKAEHNYRFFINMYSKEKLSTDLRGKKILVIDDNASSGSTIQQISDILVKNNPSSIDFFVPYLI